MTVISFDQEILKILVAEPGRIARAQLRLLQGIKDCTPAQTASFIRKALRRERAASRRVILNIPRNIVTLKNLVLPAAGRDDVASMVRFQVTRIVPHPLSEIVYAFGPIAQSHERGIVVRAGVLHRKALDPYLAVLEAAGLQLEAVRVGVEELGGLLDQPGYCAVLELDYAQSAIALSADGRTQFSRSIPLGAAHLHPGAQNHHQTVLDFLAELEASIALFPPEAAKAGLPIVLTGAPEAVELLESPIRDSMKMAVQTREFLPVFPDREENELARRVSFAGILALSADAVQRSFLNFLPEDVRIGGERARFMISLRRLAAAAGISILSGVFFFLNEISMEQRRLDALSVQIRSIEKSAKELEILQDKVRMLKRHIDRLGNCLKAMGALFTVIPDGIFLKSLSYDTRRVHLRGYASTLSKVFELTSALDQSPAVEKVDTRYARQGSAARKELAEFHVECTLAISKEAPKDRHDPS